MLTINNLTCRWKPFDPSRNWPDLGPKFKVGEDRARAALAAEKKLKLKDLKAKDLKTIDSKTTQSDTQTSPDDIDIDPVENDKRDLDWSAVLKRTFESYLRGERPNMYGEWLQW